MGQLEEAFETTKALEYLEETPEREERVWVWLIGKRRRSEKVLGAVSTRKSILAQREVVTQGYGWEKPQGVDQTFQTTSYENHPSQQRRWN